MNLRIVVPLGLVVFSLLAQAQSKNDLAITLTAQKVVVTAEGKEMLVAADKAFPGDIIEYTGVFKNTTAKDIGNLKPVIPIPVGMTYIGGSAKPKPDEASLEGKNYAPYPLKRKVKLADGKEEEQAVPWSDYRSVRWNTGDLKAGETVILSLRARLNPTTTNPPAK